MDIRDEGWSEWRKTDNSNIHCRNQDLSNLDLSNRNFRFVEFWHCNLEGTVFNNSTFNYSRFAHCELDHASFINCDLSEIDLSYSDFTDADLSGADLNESDFFCSCLMNVHLNNTKLAWDSPDLISYILESKDRRLSGFILSAADIWYIEFFKLLKRREKELFRNTLLPLMDKNLPDNFRHFLLTGEV